jgi:hypothetical protein
MEEVHIYPSELLFILALRFLRSMNTKGLVSVDLACWADGKSDSRPSPTSQEEERPGGRGLRSAGGGGAAVPYPTNHKNTIHGRDCSGESDCCHCHRRCCRRRRRHGFPHPLPAAEAEANCFGASGRRISAVEEAHAAALRPQLRECG